MESLADYSIMAWSSFSMQRAQGVKQFSQCVVFISGKLKSNCWWLKPVVWDISSAGKRREKRSARHSTVSRRYFLVVMARPVTGCLVAGGDIRLSTVHHNRGEDNLKYSYSQN